MRDEMREIRTDVEVLIHAISDGINGYIAELTQRGIVDEDAWGTAGADSDLIRLKYEVAAQVAARWAVSWRNEEG
jgi:hypothetical protein